MVAEREQVAWRNRAHDDDVGQLQGTVQRGIAQGAGASEVALLELGHGREREAWSGGEHSFSEHAKHIGASRGAVMGSSTAVLIVQLWRLQGWNIGTEPCVGPALPARRGA